MDKFSIKLLLLILGIAASEIPKPQVTIGISNSGFGNFQDGNLGGVEPIVTWQTKGSTSTMDWEAGLELQMKTKTSLPCSYWAKAKREIQGYVLSARGSTTSKSPEIMDLDLRADGPSLSIQLNGRVSAAKSYIQKALVRQSLNLPAGRMTVTPRFDMASRKADIALGYAVGGTSLSMDSGSQTVTLAQMVGDKTVLMPTVGTDGSVEVSIQRRVEGLGTITTTLQPSEAIRVQWEEGPYVANIRAPLHNFSLDNVEVRIKRKVEL